MSAAVISQTFRAVARGALEHAILDLRLRLMSTLAPEQASMLAEPGLKVALAGDQLVRWHMQPADGVLLMELCGRDPAGDFELFVVPHEDGDLRTGWRRRWATSTEPPLAWHAVTEVLELAGQIHPRVDPDFAVLLAALSTGGPPAISYDDCDARASLAADIRHLREVVERQAAQLRKLQFAAAARPVDPVSSVVPPPTQREWRLSDLSEWADLHADTITILPRAIAEAKKSDLENQQLAFDALNLLAHTYRLVKLSELPREDFKTQAEQLGLFVGGSISFPGEHGDAYYVQYAGRRRLLDQHVGRSTSRDSRFSLRVYFFWDDETKRAVVGWLPSHLPNSLT